MGGFKLRNAEAVYLINSGLPQDRLNGFSEWLYANKPYMDLPSNEDYGYIGDMWNEYVRSNQKSRATSDEQAVQNQMRTQYGLN